MAVAVRQTPLTAIESPKEIPATVSGALITRIALSAPKVIEAIVPTSVTSPVNTLATFLCNEIM
jgi:hypothetical protein